MKNSNTALSDERDTLSLENESANYYDMIVFCHLRWQFVYQRPQHIISRMAKELKVLMIEEPINFSPDEENMANMTIVTPQLHILQPKVKNIASIAEILPKYINNLKVPIGWFYSASFGQLTHALDFDTIIYDCMDELSLFKGAPQELIDQEKMLLSKADLVFTGGKSLFESKKQLHNRVYCFPSSVDEAHFAQALNGVAIPQDIASISSPIVGYFGVIDERLDLDLLKETAAKMPDVSFAMIGPLAKIEEANLPKAANIYYLGMKSYEELPGYLKAFDIAMMPFALNDATKFISPTKTLEYMAAGKPIISTRITDVMRDYSHCVELVDDASEFSDAITDILNNKNDKHTLAIYSEILKNTSWDATVSKMNTIIKKYAL